MKTIVTLLTLFVAQSLFAQKIETPIEQFTVKSIKIECASAEELREIDWNSIEELLQLNDEEDIIELQFGLHNKKESKKVKGSFNFTVKGKKKDVYQIIKRAKKGVKGLKSMSNKIDKINED